MTSAAPEGSTTSNAHTPLARNTLSQALEVDVYDHEGKTEKLGNLIKGKRTVLIFIRHFCEFSYASYKLKCAN
jgi:hypothetical protein